MTVRTGLEQDVIDYARSVDEIYEKTLEMLFELTSLGDALAEQMQMRRLNQPLELTTLGLNERALARYATRRVGGSLNLSM